MHRSGPSLLLFFSIITLVVGGIHYYLWSRLIRAPELGADWQRRGGYLFVGLALLTPLGLMAGSILPRRAASIASWASYGWMGVSILLLFLLLGSELVRVIIHGYNAVSSAPADPERRLAISRGIAGVVAFAGLGAAVTGTASALGQVALRNVKVPLRRLSPSLSGFRIAQLTDVHIGPTLGRAGCGTSSRTPTRPTPISSSSPVISSTAPWPPSATTWPRSPTSRPSMESTSSRAITSITPARTSGLPSSSGSGIRVLRNERVAIGGEDGFDLAGVDDWSSKRFGNGHGPDLERALKGRDPSRELVLLAHQPKQIHEAAAQGVGLQLSGHTHGGRSSPGTSSSGSINPMSPGSIGTWTR